MLYRINSKVLTVHIDESDEIISSHKVQRYLIDEEKMDEVLLWKMREFIIQESYQDNRKVFVVGYDTSTDDPKKAFKSAKKLSEGFKAKLAMDFIQSRSFGNIEKINDTIPGSSRDFNKHRLELWITDFPLENIIESEIPILFNPNDFHLIEKYKISLKGLLYKLILSENKSDILISAMKPWTSSKKTELNESLKKTEDEKTVTLLEYSSPNKLSATETTNRPKITNQKVTIQELTEKRAISICYYLNLYAENYGFKFIPEGLGVKQGAPQILIQKV